MLRVMPLALCSLIPPTFSEVTTSTKTWPSPFPDVAVSNTLSLLGVRKRNPQCCYEKFIFCNRNVDSHGLFLSSERSELFGIRPDRFPKRQTACANLSGSAKLRIHS